MRGDVVTLTTPPPGHQLFAQYAYPPNELGYCGPASHDGELALHAREFDGAWPYLAAIADAAGDSDFLNEEVVRSYWLGGPLLDKVEPESLLARLREAFTGQVTGMLSDLPSATGVLAHHSFHVFVVYPWVKFLHRDSETALRVMQDCRIRWGTVESVDGEQAVVSSRPLTLDAGELTLGPPSAETLNWSKDGMYLTPAPLPGVTISAHWDWVCGTLTEDESAALSATTQTTLDLVNAMLSQDVSILTRDRR
jgi:hypothetical protein